jgi:hypothetical protein
MDLLEVEVCHLEAVKVLRKGGAEMLQLFGRGVLTSPWSLKELSGEGSYPSVGRRLPIQICRVQHVEKQPPFHGAMASQQVFLQIFPYLSIQCNTYEACHNQSRNM